MNYIFSEDGINAVGGLRTKLPPELEGKTKEELISFGWYEYISTAPEAGENQVVKCIGFKREDDHFTGIYEIIDIEPEPEPSPEPEPEPEI